MEHRITEQLRRNAVALISLTIAVTSLGYNTWRNETTETQRNLRHAAFELVEKLAELQSVTNGLAYAPDRDPGAWVDGWGLVMTVETLGQLLPAPVPAHAIDLRASWQAEFDDLSAADRTLVSEADAAISDAIAATNTAVLGVLRELD